MRAGDIVAGKYCLRKPLGEGGMGAVWAATHVATGRDFAIKFMQAHSAQSESSRQRFAREARASARINHPAIIDVFDVGSLEDGSLYLVMELLDGVSLAESFYAQPPLTVQAFVAVMLEAARALAAAHAAGIVHRDIKPPNIFLHRDRATGLASPKLLDFGVSKFSTNEDAFMTKTGSVLGSPRYMSPEQARSSAAADHRSDVWAMGVILFEGLTGQWPHDGDSFSGLVVAIATQAPKSIDALAPHVPEELRSIIREALLPADRRLPSASALAARLELALERPELAQLTLPRPLRRADEAVRTTGDIRVRIPTPSGSGVHPAPVLNPSIIPSSGSWAPGGAVQPVTADQLAASIGGMNVDALSGSGQKALGHVETSRNMGAPPSVRSRRALGVAATAATAAIVIFGVAIAANWRNRAVTTEPSVAAAPIATAEPSTQPTDAPTVPANDPPTMTAPVVPSVTPVTSTAPSATPSATAATTTEAGRRPAPPTHAPRPRPASTGKSGPRIDQLGSGL